MRYAAELFAALHDRKRATRFIARLTALQEQLGHLNDGVAAATQLDTIGPAGRGYGGGIARGLVAARSTGLRREIERTWRRLRAAKRFWT
jgi:CHAD domain-containing protein